MRSVLRTTVVIDYQNVHLTGHHLFAGPRRRRPQDTQIDPVVFSRQLIEWRNTAQYPGFAHADLRRVLVFRGIPAAEHQPRAYANVLAQQERWQRDHRVTVTLRPLKYSYQRDQQGRVLRDADGRKLLDGPPREKGIDVLCALAAVREARDPEVDLVVIASSDSDLVPAVDEIRAAGLAKVESFVWWGSAGRRAGQLRPTHPAPPIWCTKLDGDAFERSRDQLP